MVDDLLAAHRMRALADMEKALESRLRRHLGELGRPIAEAMQRQDSLLELRADAIEDRMRMDLEEVTELLMEVLNSLQPTARETLLPGGSMGLPQPLASALSAQPSRATSSTVIAMPPTSRH